MASTFRRKGPSTTDSSLLGLKGTKPWTSGVTLASTGLRDLDNLLLGGHAVGTCFLLEEDRSSVGSPILKYWCAEALSHDQHLLIPCRDDERSESLASNKAATNSWDDPVDDKDTVGIITKSDVYHFLSALPRNLNAEKLQSDVATVTVTDHASSRPATGALDTLDEENEAEEGLKIAWQYRKYVQEERLGNISEQKRMNPTSAQVFCHSYDLNAVWTSTPPQQDVAHVFRVDDNAVMASTDKDSGFRLFRRIRDEIEGLAQTPRRLVRLFFCRCDISVLVTTLPLLLSYIRSKELPVVLFVSVQPWKQPSAPIHLLRRSCDYVLEAEGFAYRLNYPPPPEFRHLQGLLKVHKLVATNASAHGHFADATNSKRPAATLYGLKRDRRKLHIQLLHIPPEEYAHGGGSVGTGVRSGAGRVGSEATTSVGCSTGVGSPSLDF